MSKTREDVIREQHHAFGVEVDVEPTVKILTLRKTLISEETKELIEDLDEAIAYLERGEEVPRALWINALKEMSDVQIVLSGTAASVKQLRELDEAFLRVNASNMSKLDDEGKPIYREDGKFLKGPNYFPPNLEDLVPEN